MAIREKVGKTAGKIRELLHDSGPEATNIAGKVGETAGQVWQVLESSGPQTLAQIKKAVKEPTEVVLFAVGWLAREDKLNIAVEKTGFKLSLR